MKPLCIPASPNRHLEPHTVRGWHPLLKTDKFGAPALVPTEVALGLKKDPSAAGRCLVSALQGGLG
jgi:hypothetical protein